MERLPTELLAHILRTDEDPAASYTSSAFKRHQAGLRKLCTVSRYLCRVARPLVWRVVVLKREEQAASLIRLILSPSSGDLAQLPETLFAAQSTSRRTLTADEDRNGDAPGLLMPTTVSRLVAKLSGLRRVYLTDFKAIQNNDTSFDGKISIDFSSSGPLRSASDPPLFRPRAASEQR